MKTVFCLVHNVQAEQLCLNRECKSKKIKCSQCISNDDQKENCQDCHKEDILFLADFSDKQFNESYHQIRGQYLKDEEYLIRSIANLNRFKFEKLGRDFYYFLKDQTLKGYKLKSNKQEISNVDELLQYDTSQFKFRTIFDNFAASNGDSLKNIQQNNETDKEVIINLETKILSTLVDDLQIFNNDLIKCQDILQNTQQYQDNYSDQEIESLFKKLKRVITEFVDKKIKKKNKKKKITNEDISQIDCKFLTQKEDKEQPNIPEKSILHEINSNNLEAIPLLIQPIEEENKNNEEIPKPIERMGDSNQQENQKIPSFYVKQEFPISNQIASTGSLQEIEDLHNAVQQNETIKNIKLLNDITLKAKNKVYRLKLSPDQRQLSITCGGWTNTTGNCLLYDLDFYQSDFELRKTISYGSYRFIDSAFSPCGQFLFLSGNNKIFVYKTDVNNPIKNKDLVDKTPVLKISISFEARAIEVRKKENAGLEQSNEIEYILAVGGNNFFEIIAVKLQNYGEMISYTSDFIAVVQGQVENLKFFCQDKFVAFTVYETQQISLYDMQQKQICYISQPLGFQIWFMQVEPEYGFIAVSGEHSQIHLYSIDLQNSSLFPIVTIETQFTGIITAFDFYKKYVFITCSDNSFKIYEQKIKQLTNEMYYEKIYSSQPSLHLMPTLTFCSKYTQIITGCQRGALYRWQFCESDQ